MDKDKLHELYIVQDLGQRQTADKLGCSQTNVRHWLKKYGIAKPKRKVSLPKSQTCLECKILKPASDYYIRKNRGQLYGHCKKCANTERVIRQVERKTKYVNLHGGKCQSCGFNRYMGALEFHHSDHSTKEKSVSLTRRGKHEDIMAELSKCVLVCANCHRMIHGGKIPNPQTKGYLTLAAPIYKSLLLTEHTKCCSKCKTIKPLNDFRLIRKRGKLVENSWCKQCNKIQTRERARRHKMECVEYKGSRCQSCGYDSYIGALEFHHIDPKQKSFSVNTKPPTAIVLKELDKCVLVCANCHRMIHADVIECPEK